MFGVIDTDQLSIMSEALGCDIDLNGRYRNPLRKDENAGCYLRWHNKVLYFIDFAYSPSHISAVKMLELTKGIKLNIFYENSNSVEFKPKVNNTKIDVELRSFNYDDERYWMKYNLPIDLVREYDCRAVNKLFINGRYVGVDKHCYAIFVEGRVKVYSPYSKNMKWVCNTLNNHIGMLRKLNTFGDRVIITKSFKDALCLKMLGYSDVCWVQSEGVMLEKRMIYSFTKRFKEVIIFFDNDDVGKSYSKRLVEKILCVDDRAIVKSIFIDGNDKDISDYVFRYGSDKAKKHMEYLLN